MLYTLTLDDMRHIDHALKLAIKDNKAQLLRYFLSRKREGDGKTIMDNGQAFAALQRRMKTLMEEQTA